MFEEDLQNMNVGILIGLERFRMWTWISGTFFLFLVSTQAIHQKPQIQDHIYSIEEGTYL